jgi:hypothetical protein
VASSEPVTRREQKRGRRQRIATDAAAAPLPALPPPSLLGAEVTHKEVEATQEALATQGTEAAQEAAPTIVELPEHSECSDCAEEEEPRRAEQPRDPPRMSSVDVAAACQRAKLEQLRQQLRAAEEVCSALAADRRRLEQQAAQHATTAHAVHEQSLCSICLECPKSHVFTECMHKCVCADCAATLTSAGSEAGTECPICRVRSSSVRRVFE